MAFQTFENDKNNRGQTKRKNLKNEIRSTWLGMRDSNPRSRDQNPLPYRLANPHRRNLRYYLVLTFRQKLRFLPRFLLSIQCSVAMLLGSLNWKVTILADGG